MSEQNSNSESGNSKNVTDFTNFPRGAIGKRGLPATRNARLPSIRNPRDLTLGGLSLGVAPKRTFVPNIPVRREKSQDAKKGLDKGNQKVDGSINYRGKDVKSERGRGRERHRPEYIQTSGIFSEGVGSGMKKSSSNFHPSSSEPVIPPKVPRTVFAATVKKEIKDDDYCSSDKKNPLIDDDFIDYDSDGDSDDGISPVFFESKIVNSNLRVKKEPEDIKNKIKKEKREIKTEEAEAMEISGVQPKVAAKSEPVEPRDIFVSDDIPEDKQLLFFQFPDVLGIPPQPEDGSRSQSKTPGDASTSEKASSNSGRLPIADLPEGRIGKLQILKSGKTRLVLGSLVLDVQMGTNSNRLQQLVSIKTGMSGGDMTVLGHVHHKLVCVPDVENLLSQCSL